MNSNIRIQLYPYGLSQGKDDKYTARLSSEGPTLDNAAVCRSALCRRPSSLSEETMIHAVSVYFEELAYLLCNGHAVANGYFTAQAYVKGVFDAIMQFDPKRHDVVIEFRQGAMLRKMAASVKVKVLGLAYRRVIDRVIDVASGSIDHNITPKQMLIVQGRKLKLAGSDPSVGIHFTNHHTGEVYQVPANTLAENHPTRLLFLVPDLPPGDYRLSVTTQYVGRSEPTKQSFTIDFQFPLTVADNSAHPSVPDAALPPPADSNPLSPLSTTLTRTSQPSRPMQVSYSDPHGSNIPTSPGQDDTQGATATTLPPVPED